MPKGLDYVINIKDGSFGGVAKAKTEVQGLDNAVGTANKNMGGLGSTLRGIGSLVAGAFAVSEIFSFGAASQAAFKATEFAAAQANAAIISTGGAAGKSLDDLKRQANELENTTLFGDEQTLGAQSLLLTFTNIKGKIFDEAIPAIQDMAQRMAGDGPADLKGASIQVGKALNDPIQGINALRRVGVSFSDQQKEQIGQMVAVGNTAGAQALILRELNTEFGGSAKAARDTIGPTADLEQATGDLKKNMGSLINEGLNFLVPKLVGLTNALSSGVDWFKENKETIGTVTEVVLVGAAAYALYQGYLLATQAPLAIITAGQWLLNAAMSANPIGLIVTGIGLLAGGLYVAYQKSETFRAGLAGIIGVGKILGDVFMGVGKIIIGALTFDKSLFIQGVTQTVAVAKDIAAGGIGKAFNNAYDSSLAESRKKSVEKDKGSALDALTGKSKGFAGAAGGGAAAAGGGGSASATTVASNRQVRNVQVTINKLVENLTVQTTNLTGVGSADIKRMITEVLVGAVHDSELALS